MRIHPRYYPAVLVVLTLLLAACSGQSDDPEAVQVEPATAPTIAHAATPEPTDTPEPTALPEPTATSEPTETAADVLSSEGYETYEATAFDLQLAHPAGWVVTEDPELGLTLESSEGYYELIPNGEGAILLLLPNDELAAEDVVEALRQSIFNFGPPPSIFIERPTVTENGGQQLATAPFREQEANIHGLYAFVKNGDERGAFIFAATAGFAKGQFLSELQTIIGSIALAN